MASMDGLLNKEYMLTVKEDGTYVQDGKKRKNTGWKWKERKELNLKNTPLIYNCT